MSRSFHQHHPGRINKKAKRPRVERNRKHKPYGMKKTGFPVEVFVKRYHWTMDAGERWEGANISNKAKARREGKEEIDNQLKEGWDLL